MRYITYAAGLALMVGVVGCKDDGRTPGEQVDKAVDNAGDATQNAVNATTQGASNIGEAIVRNTTPSGADEPAGMRSTMEGIVQNALDADNFNTMTNHLVDADQKRLENADANTEQLDTEISKFKEAWEAKYGADVFAVMDRDKIFSENFVKLSSMTGDGGKKMGKATIMASHGMPEVELPMVAQDGKWRLDIADDMDAVKVRANLMEAVKDLNAKSSQWPADATQATQQAAHRILMALAGK